MMNDVLFSMDQLMPATMQREGLGVTALEQRKKKNALAGKMHKFSVVRSFELAKISFVGCNHH